MRIFCTARRGKGGSEVVYDLLEYAVNLIYGLKRMPEIVRTENGKPYFSSYPDIYFSLSHSRSHVLCAVSPFPVGADIESPRTISARAIRYFSTPDELNHFDPLNLWVLKESYVKLYGLRLPIVKTLRFSCSESVIIAPGHGVTAALYYPCGCHAAICCKDGPPASGIEIVDIYG